MAETDKLVEKNEVEAMVIQEEVGIIKADMVAVNTEVIKMKDVNNEACEIVERREDEECRNQRTVMLLDLKDGNKFFMFKEVDASTGLVIGYQIYLEKNGIPLISAEKDIKLTRQKLLNAKNFTVMNILQNFYPRLSVEEIKEAHEVARNFCECDSGAIYQNVGKSIPELYSKFIKLVQERSSEEDYNNIEKKYKRYDYNNTFVEIETKEFDKVLEEIGAGMSKIKFTRALTRLIGTTGNELVIDSNDGRNAINRVGNVRVYRFAIIKSLLEAFERNGV